MMKKLFLLLSLAIILNILVPSGAKAIDNLAGRFITQVLPASSNPGEILVQKIDQGNGTLF